MQGTAALHLGLILLGVQLGDEVICQSFTFAASANPIAYLEATPVFVDSEKGRGTWIRCCWKRRSGSVGKRQGKLPKAIIPVHLYGMPVKMDEVMEMANRYGIPVLEDSAEALGSEYKGRKCGTFGSTGVLSFNREQDDHDVGRWCLDLSERGEGETSFVLCHAGRGTGPITNTRRSVTITV